MDRRKLQFKTEEQRKAGEGYISSPAVFTFIGEDNSPGFYPIYGLDTEMIDGEVHVAAATVNGIRYYPLVREEDLKVNETRGDITFSSYGKIYTIRAFQDSDGAWASKLRYAVPAEALEETYMAEVESAFSPNAPAEDENLYAAVDGETDEVKYLVYSCDSGMYIRDNSAWAKLPKEDDSLDDLEVYEVTPKFIKVFDMAEANEDQLLADDARSYEVEFRGALTAAGAPDCPPATQDIAINLANREKAIKMAAYGPLNPAEPNEEFWADKADRWSVSSDDAKKSVCGNCAVFIRTKDMLNCIATGIEAGDSSEQNAWDAIDAAELGYCESFDFKCAASRTCDAWVAGGPITDSSEEESA